MLPIPPDLMARIDQFFSPAHRVLPEQLASFWLAQRELRDQAFPFERFPPFDPQEQVRILRDYRLPALCRQNVAGHASHVDRPPNPFDAHCPTSPRQAVLADSINIPPNVAWGGGYQSLVCSVALRDASPAPVDGDEPMSIWHLAATFTLQSGGQGIGRLAGLMCGYYVLPFSESSVVDANLFADRMVDHSCDLNDIWKVLQFEYFPAHGYASVSDFASARRRAIAALEVELAPAIRGKDMLPVLLQMLHAMFAEYPSTQLDDGWERLERPRPPAPGQGRAPREFPFVAPGVLLFPVAGTPPDQVVAEPSLERSPNRVNSCRRDVAAERYKEKVSARFHSLDWKRLGAHVVVYDPWRWPTT